MFSARHYQAPRLLTLRWQLGAGVGRLLLLLLLRRQRRQQLLPDAHARSALCCQHRRRRRYHAARLPRLLRCPQRRHQRRQAGRRLQQQLVGQGAACRYCSRRQRGCGCALRVATQSGRAAAFAGAVLVRVAAMVPVRRVRQRLRRGRHGRQPALLAQVPAGARRLVAVRRRHLLRVLLHLLQLLPDVGRQAAGVGRAAARRLLPPRALHLLARRPGGRRRRGGCRRSAVCGGCRLLRRCRGVLPAQLRQLLLPLPGADCREAGREMGGWRAGNPSMHAATGGSTCAVAPNKAAPAHLETRPVTPHLPPPTCPPPDTCRAQAHQRAYAHRSAAAG